MSATVVPVESRDATATEPPAKLLVDGLCVTRRSAHGNGELRVLDRIDFAIRAREFVAIVGPSGCGKTTLLGCLVGLDRATGGRVLLDGADGAGGGSGRAMVFQAPTLLPWRNVSDNVAYGLAIQGRDGPAARQRVAALIALVGLAGFERAYPHELSGGMQQRVNLARALAVEPEVLLMDEPFAALDAQTREDMQSELLRIWEFDRKTVVFITHQIDEAVYLSDRVLVMSPRPSRILSEIPITLDRPRQPRIKRTARFNALVDEIAELVMHGRGGDGRAKA
ncbi:MAG: ATP-binding cassette domain-containing protein [Rhodospirillales bacterium]|nr:ATP-binding cassette domain-containing protein [Rhodospirillales bacterium]